MNVSLGVTANKTEFSYNAEGLISGNLIYFDTKANNTEGWDQSGGVLSFFTKPEDPDSIICTATTGVTADFSVDKADMGADAISYTYARWSTTAFPTSRTEGSFGFNSTSTTPQITGLTPSTHYYLSVWACCYPKGNNMSYSHYHYAPDTPKESH